MESAIYLSGSFGVSELGIGLTVVAIGTSLPEMATSIMAAARGQTDIAVGNVIGSNIFNIAGVLGVTSLIKPMAVDPGVLWVELPAVVLVSLMALLVTLSPLTKGSSAFGDGRGRSFWRTYVWVGFFGFF